MEVDELLVNRNIRFLRISNGYTLESFGKIFDISSRALSNYEQGIRKVPVVTVIKISEYFGIDLTTIFTKDISLLNGNELTNYKDIKDIINEIRVSPLISEEDKKVILPILEMIYSKENK